MEADASRPSPPVPRLDAAALKQRLWTRLDRYVRMETTSDEASTTTPSTPGQRVLTRMLQRELLELGVAQVTLSDHGYLYATIPPHPEVEHTTPPIGFIAHVDTSPAVSGRGVVPRLHREYAGGDLTINSAMGLSLSPRSCPELERHLGHDLVTASGDTLLGADNKAGVAILVSLAELLVSNPGVPHGPVYLAFTVDEEIGRGMDHFDLGQFPAQYAYTLDGGTLGSLEYECFNADAITVEIVGRSIHPGTAKGQMANATRIAAEVIAHWPDSHLPENTAERDGFVLFSEVVAGIERARINGIVRDHDLRRLRDHEKLLTALVEMLQVKHPRALITLSFREQYRNMRQVIDKHPRVLNHLYAAYREVGVEPRVTPIRGGTDGSRLSFMGIPTPNIFTGGCNYHARDEWVSLDSMATAVRLLVALLRRWTEPDTAS